MIDIKSGPLLPWHFRLVTLLMIVAGIVVFTQSLLLSIILIGAGLAMLTAYEGTDIDIVNNRYREYTSFFFIKMGKFETLTPVERIFIVSGKMKQQLYTAHTTHSSTFENVMYNAYLKFSTDEKILLLSGKNKAKLMEKLIPLSDSLKVELVDYTE